MSVLISNFSDLGDLVFSFFTTFTEWLTTDTIGILVLFVILFTFVLTILKTLVSFFRSG